MSTLHQFTTKHSTNQLKIFLTILICNVTSPDIKTTLVGLRRITQYVNRKRFSIKELPRGQHYISVYNEEVVHHPETHCAH
jgi:hypothetical protein